MFKSFYALRHISLIAVVCSFLGSVVMFCGGALKTGKALAVFFTPWRPAGYDSVPTVALATKYIVQSLDAFLVALVLMIFAFGIYGLVVKEIETEKLPASGWLRITSIAHLKNTLAEVIIVILFVQFLELVLLGLDKLAWTMLVVPVGIVLLAVSLKLLALREE